MSRTRDFQKTKLFRWERQYQEKSTTVREGYEIRYRCENEMTLAECKTLADKMAKRFRITPRIVEDGRGRRCAYSYGGRIALPKWARQPVVVAHEMAHEITGVLHGNWRIASHGREFLGVQMYLLVEFAGQDIKDLVRTANAVNLQFDSIHKVKELLKDRRRRVG